MEQYEYIGEIRPDGALKLYGKMQEAFAVGERLRVVIEKISAASETKNKKKLDPATLRILEKMKNANTLGAPDNPEALKHSTLMEERFTWKD